MPVAVCVNSFIDLDAWWNRTSLAPCVSCPQQRAPAGTSCCGFYAPFLSRNACDLSAMPRPVGPRGWPAGTGCLRCGSERAMHGAASPLLRAGAAANPFQAVQSPASRVSGPMRARVRRPHRPQHRCLPARCHPLGAHPQTHHPPCARAF